jgi:hypothetical protein
MSSPNFYGSDFSRREPASSLTDSFRGHRVLVREAGQVISRQTLRNCKSDLTYQIAGIHAYNPSPRNRRLPASKKSRSSP